MISNIKILKNSKKFDIGIFYVFNIRIIKISLKVVFIRSNLFFFEICDLILLAIFLLFTFFFEFGLFFPFFPQ